jgi:hypothetical protein
MPGIFLAGRRRKIEGMEEQRGTYNGKLSYSSIFGNHLFFDRAFPILGPGRHGTS